MAQTLFAKQPIFDADLNIKAYELLFRSDKNNQATFVDGDQATSHVLLYAFGQHKISDLIGSAPAFVNFTDTMLIHPPPMPPEKLVIEVLEGVTPNKHVIEGLASLKEQGYTIALDDFFLTKETKQLVSYADIIKIDVLALSKDKLKKTVEKLKPFKIQLLAEKIETYEMLEQCKSLGFELFQGYFLSKPHLVEGEKVEESKESVLRLLATLTEPEVDMKALSNVIASDPRLSYRILKIVNSSASGTRCEIESLAQAVSMLGIDQIRNWAMVMILAAGDSKPMELSLLGMTRAKFGELIGRSINGPGLAEQCFTTGVLSTFDAFLDLPLPELIEKLSLSKVISDGLTDHQGDTGQVLQMVKNFEVADWGTMEAQLKQPLFAKIDDRMLNEHYIEAVSWAHQTFKCL